jgi:putative ABC transport system substrate-binding protein
MADLVHRQVAVIATPGTTVAALAAKTATTTIPIVFGVAGDPVALGLVVSLAQPGSNATGTNFFFNELVAKRLRLLHDLVPKAVHVAVLVNPANAASTEATLREVREAAATLGLQIRILKATTIAEIDVAFAILGRDHPDSLFVAADPFFSSRRGQLATLSSRERIPAAYAARNYVAAGGLMSYGTDIPDTFHQVGVYTGKILNGAKPANLPVPIAGDCRPRSCVIRPSGAAYSVSRIPAAWQCWRQSVAPHRGSIAWPRSADRADFRNRHTPASARRRPAR